jgi:hypothetical protein
MENERRFAKRFLLWQIPLFLFAVLYGLCFLWAEARGLSLFSCRVRDTLGLYCPGCGGTRAAVALVRGRLLHSLCCNPLAIYLAVGFLVYDSRVAIAIARDEPQLPRVLARYFWGMLFLAAAHFFARNTLMIGWGYDYLGDLATYWHP